MLPRAQLSGGYPAQSPQPRVLGQGTDLDSEGDPIKGTGYHLSSVWGLRTGPLLTTVASHVSLSRAPQ